MANNVSSWAQQMLATYFPSTPSTPTSTPSGYANSPSTGQSVVSKPAPTNTSTPSPSVSQPVSAPANTGKTIIGYYGGTSAIPQKYVAYSDGTSAPVSGGTTVPPVTQPSQTGGGSSSVPSSSTNQQLSALQQQLQTAQQQLNVLTEVQNKTGGAITDTNQIPADVLSGAASVSDFIKTTNEKRAAEEAAKKKKEAEYLAEKTVLEQQAQLENLKTMITQLQAARPATQSMVEEGTKLLDTGGVTTLRQNINDIDAQIRDTQASLRQGLYSQEGRLAPMELISTRQNQLKRQGEETINMLTSQKQAYVDQYNAALDNVRMIMDWKQTDYANAMTAYNTMFSQTLAAQQAISTAENQYQDNIRANMTLTMNMIKESGQPITDPAIQTQLATYAAQIGIPFGAVASYLNSSNSESKIIAHNVVDNQGGGKSWAIINQAADGSISTSTVAIPGSKSSGTTAPSNIKTLTPADRAALQASGLSGKAIDTIQSDLNEYGKVSGVELNNVQKGVLNSLLKGETPSYVTRPISEWSSYVKEAFGDELINYANAKQTYKGKSGSVTHVPGLFSSDKEKIEKFTKLAVQLLESKNASEQFTSDDEIISWLKQLKTVSKKN